ncbi:MAG: hypothetical protein AB7L66_06030 [Gemmatimonadales bacterium]
MKLIDRDETVVVVVGGAGEPPPDRPLADNIRREIDGRADGRPYRRAVVVSDAEFLESPELHSHPTIAIGGPGANAVVQRLVSELPTLWQREERAFVQAEIDDARRVALWGMDREATAQAVEAFLIEGYLDALLERIWRTKPTVWM